MRARLEWLQWECSGSSAIVLPLCYDDCIMSARLQKEHRLLSMGIRPLLLSVKRAVAMLTLHLTALQSRKDNWTTTRDKSPQNQMTKFGTSLFAVLLLCAVAMPAHSESRQMEQNVITVIDRNDIALSGLTTVSELIFGRRFFNDFGISQAMFGSNEIAIMINSRIVPGVDLDTLPLSIVERIEILDRGIVVHGEGAISGTINIVIKSKYEGGQIEIGMARPKQDGGNADNGSAVWTGNWGQGRILVGAGTLSREEVRDANRDFSRASWTDNGSYEDTQGVSIIGNTLIVPNQGFHAIGDCKEEIYTGVLTFRNGTVCGYPFANVKWVNGYQDHSRNNVILAWEQPLENNSSMYLETRAVQGDSFFVYAPSAGNFQIQPVGSVRDRLFQAVPDLENNLGNSDVELYHRFVSNGNREWKTDLTENDIALGIRSSTHGNGIGYDLHVLQYRHKEVEKGENFVSESLAISQIESGAYDIASPLTPEDPTAHRQAVRDITLRMNHVTVREHTKLGARFNGLFSEISGGNIQWTGGVEFMETDWSDVYDYRNLDGDFHEPTDVIGSAGASSVGERSRISAFAELFLPASSAWGMSLGFRMNDYDDVGETASRRIASRYRFNDAFHVRASWDDGEGPPDLNDMHRQEGLSYPVVCSPVCRQVEVVSRGNPHLAPDSRERLKIGATARIDKFTFDLDWFSVENLDQAGSVSPQVIVDEVDAGRQLSGTEVRRVGGEIVQIVNPVIQVSDTKARGVSLHSSAKWGTSHTDFSVDVHALHTTHFENRVLGIKSPEDYPRNRIHAILRAARDNTTVSWNIHSVSGYWNNTRTGRYNRWTGHDIAAQWKNAFGHQGLVLTGGVLNVGNEGPALDSSSDTNPVLTNDSVYGRTVFLTAKLSW